LQKILLAGKPKPTEKVVISKPVCKWSGNLAVALQKFKNNLVAISAIEWPFVLTAVFGQIY